MPVLVPGSLSTLVSHSANHGNLRCATALHGTILKTGAHTDNFHGNAIVNLYGRCGRLAEAVRAFDEIRNRDVGSWNCLINRLPDDTPLVLDLFRRMRSDDPHVLPNSFTFTGVFASVSRSRPEAGGGLQVHALAIKNDVCTDLFVGSSLINMYCKLGRLSDARKVFDRMPVRNSVTWATMISGYANERRGVEAFSLLRSITRVDRTCVNEFVLTSVLSALAEEDFLRMGEQVHCWSAKNGLYSSVPVKNALVTVYTKCGLLHDALSMFESAAERSSITWSAMVTGFAQNGSFHEAVGLYSEMHRAGVMPSEYTFVGVLNACSDGAALAEAKQAHAHLLKLGHESQVYVQSALLSTYARCKVVDDARRCFDQIVQPDTVLWTTMISGYVQNGENEEALNLYGRMGALGATPNDLTLASLLRSCSGLGNLELGRQLHVLALKHGFSLDTPIGTALLTMYAKCADLDQSHLVFRRMQARDVVAWNSIISAFANNGQAIQALQLFDEMVEKGTTPNHITFVNVLAACSRIGLVERGWDYFRAMWVEHGLVPEVEHYACMVDVLGRAGLLEEAKAFVESAAQAFMEHRTRRLWRVLLGACLNHRRYDLGAYAGEKLVRLGTRDSSAYVLLSNIYAASGKREGLEEVRRMMKLRGVSKDPGCSWIEIGNRVHVFLVKDQRHPGVNLIYEVVRRLWKHMIDEDLTKTCETMS